MDLRDELAALCASGDVREHLVEAAALIAASLRPQGIDPILVGGGAAQFHTAGQYVSGDIDFVAAGDPTPALTGLGFEKRGRHFVHPSWGLWIEFPSGHLDPDESTVTIDVRGRSLRILSAPDLLLDRLNAYKWGGSEADGVNALLLMRLHPAIVDEELRRRAQRDRVLDALDGLWAERSSTEPVDVVASRIRQRLEET